MSISSFLTKKFLKSLFFPAHNRGEALPKGLIELLKKEPASWDLPELPEIGSPLSSSGLINDAQISISRKFNTKKCFFGVNGASGLIQSGIIAMAKPGEFILMPRNVHISAIKACVLQNIIPLFFDLEFSHKTGHYLPITTKWFTKILDNLDLKNKKVAGVILVSPYYQGYATDLEPLINICHQHNLPVLVDEAHGAYFLLCENFNLPKSAVRLNADLVVHSLHKSLNGLTQTAVLWHNGNLIEEKNVIRSLNLLQTTSANSLLIASCEESINDWLNEDNLEKYKKRILEAKSIFHELTKRKIPVIETQDPLKIVLNTSVFGIDGFTADRFFYKNGMIAELPELMTLTFCLGFSNHADFIMSFQAIWEKLLNQTNRSFNLKSIRPPFRIVESPEIPIGLAWRMKSYSIPLAESLGKISGDIICPYPPGIPLIVPGERIDKDRIEWIKNQSLFNKDLLNSYIRVLKT